jgi:class 3 adenylate cyclase
MLKDIGVSSASHRLRIRNAIAKLRPASPLAKNENTTSAATEPKTQDTAERRQVTVMFSDLVGSTALSARMDPEDLRFVISAYQKCVAEAVQRTSQTMKHSWPSFMSESSTDHGGGKRRGSDMRSGYGVRDAVPLVGRGGAADATTA